MKLKWWNSGLAAAIALLGGCSKSKPAWEYMSDMMDQPALKAYEYDKSLPHRRSAFLPVPGTIPRGYQPYPYKEDPEAAGRELKNPLPMTKEAMLAGEKVYKTHCIVCHGEKGDGNGSVVPPFPRPPSLHSEKVRNWPDGRIFHVVTEGQNLMPSYASQINAEKRWAAIHYLRALQRAEGATQEDVGEYLRRGTTDYGPRTTDQGSGTE
ncbi:MAG: cytochrome c [Deltaproteobacteria bacterium]|nr:cytochrome c [Deltaproteobacteria bacterium]